jgi:hypothetical protein
MLSTVVAFTARKSLATYDRLNGCYYRADGRGAAKKGIT